MESRIRRWCAETGITINTEDCNGNKDCFCDCDFVTEVSDDYFFNIKAVIWYNRSLPEEDEPITHISIPKDDILELGKVISEIIPDEHLSCVILRIT